MQTKQEGVKIQHVTAIIIKLVDIGGCSFFLLVWS